MENLQFILVENVDRFDEEGNILPDKVSTIGCKFTFKGQQYGNYVSIKKPTVTAQDVMCVLEQLCPYIEQTLKELNKSM
jgi:hypothetical protein